MTSEPIQLVVHHDDLGVSHAAHVAFADLWEAGLITAGSIMVPGSWFPEIAEMARANPLYDLGVHLTLTSEFTANRWRPLTGVSKNGLTDPDGFFWPDAETAGKADPAAVEAELRAQIDAALAAGIDVTHLDTHMMTMCSDELMALYLRLGESYRLPIVVAREWLARRNRAEACQPYFSELEARGNAVFGEFVATPFGNLTPQLSDYADPFARLHPGLNFGAYHFAAPGYDAEAISPDAPTRTAEYALFRSGAIRDALTQRGIQPVGMRHLRDALRDEAARA